MKTLLQYSNFKFTRLPSLFLSIYPTLYFSLCVSLALSHCLLFVRFQSVVTASV